MAEFTINENFSKSEIEFDARFSNPQACYDYLFKQKWPDGFVCKKCSHDQYWLSKRNLYICAKCQHQHSLTAGTIMGSCKKTITYWFKAMWWFTTRKSGVMQSILKNCWALAAMGPHGLGFKSSDAAPFAMNVKNYPGVLKWMSFSSVANDPANVVKELKEKQLSQSLKSADLLKSEWGAFACMSAKSMQRRLIIISILL